MRIGIDAKWFADGPPSGRVVVRALVRELLALDSAHEWVIFVDRAMRDPFPHLRQGVRVVPVWAGNNLLSNLTTVPRVAATLGVDVTFYQNFSPVWGHGRKVAMVYDVIFASHPEYYTLVERLYFAPLRLLASRADRLCTDSKAERERMLSLGFGHEGKIDVAQLGVDEVFRPREQQDAARLAETKNRLQLPDRFILFVGRLNARKNVTGLMHALSRMRDTKTPCIVVGAGDWKRDGAAALARQLGLGERVRFLGGRPFRDLIALYSLATVFCFPSFEEGFGLPALEAMASGVPVVVSKCQSLQEICGDAALYADAGGPQEIAEQLDRVLAEEPLRQRLRGMGIERAAMFTWKRTAMSVLDCLERAVNQ